MEYIVLGLLLLSDRTIYGLRDRIDKGLYLMYSSSMGSIQAAIRKLLQNGCIRYKAFTEQGRYKKLYSITESGKVYFKEWVNQPMSQENVKNPELAKVYFMGFADREKRISNMEQYLEDLRLRYSAIAAICEEGERLADVKGQGVFAVSGEGKQNITPEEACEIFACQLAAARYGRDFLRFHIEWYEKLLQELKKEVQEI